MAMSSLYYMLPMTIAPSGNGNMRWEAVAIRLSLGLAAPLGGRGNYWRLNFGGA